MIFVNYLVGILSTLSADLSTIVLIMCPLIVVLLCAISFFAGVKYVRKSIVNEVVDKVLQKTGH